MSDLINRESLLDTIRNAGFSDNPDAMFEEIMEIIEAHPTAYDIEKVVKEMQKTMVSLPRTYYCSSDYENIKKHNQIVAKEIEIVRKGGVK